MKGFYKKLLFEIALTSIIVIALLTGIFLFGKNIAASADNITHGRKELVRRWTSLYSLATLLTDYNNKAKTAMAALEQFLPNRDQIFGLNKDFQALAAQSGVEVAFNFLSDTPPLQDSLGAVTFQLNLAAKKHSDLFQFTVQLEHFKYLSSFESFTVSNDPQRSTMVVRGKVYYR